MNRMTKFAAGLGLAFALALTPTSASAQIAILPKIGSGGLGGDVAIGLTDRLAIRGGIGFIPVELEDIELEDNEFDFSFPDFLATVGVDLKVAGPLRIMGGFLYRSGDYEYSTEVEGSIEINDVEYFETGVFSGQIENSDLAPFLGIGLGGTTGSGFGLFLDAGVAFTGAPEVTGELSGNLAAVVPAAELEAELQAINDDVPSYTEYYPFVQIGFKIGLGN